MHMMLQRLDWVSIYLGYRYLTVYDRPCHEEGQASLQPEWELDRKDLQILNQIGAGEFGTVHRAKWLGSLVAVKILKGSDAVALGDLRSGAAIIGVGITRRFYSWALSACHVLPISIVVWQPCS